MFLSGISINAPQTAIRLKKAGKRRLRRLFGLCFFEMNGGLLLYFSAASSASVLSVFSQVRSRSVLPTWP